MDFEKNLNQLEEIVKKMEKGEITLDQSLALFEQGVKLSKECHQHLAATEAKVKKLISVSADGLAVTEDFEPANE
jgi:exodeoxyribonuclease VII small subunit